MKYLKKPTLPEVRDVLLKLQTEDRQAYFFSRLHNPEWLDPLDEAGVFSKPTDPIARDGNLYFPIWAPAKYLTAIAAERPERVTAIIKAIETRNPTIHADLIEAMLRLPPNLAAQLSAKAGSWLNIKLFSRVPMVATALAEQLIKNGELRAGERLARQILSVESREREIKHPFFDRAEAVSKIFDWFYDEAVKKLSNALLDADPREALVMLSQTLMAALRIEGRAPREDDFSSVWLEDLEKEPMTHDVKDVLAVQLMHVTKTIFDRRLLNLSDVYAVLCDQESVIFERIRLRLIIHSKDLETAKSLLLSEEFWNRSGIDPERDLLANTFMDRLDDEEFEAAIIGLQRSIPMERFANWIRESNQREPTEEEMRDFRREQMGTLYARIAGVLRGQAKREYDEIVADLGQPSVPSHDHEAWIGPTSPQTASHLEQMGPAAVLAYLSEWKPRPGFREHSPEGLGRMLQPAVGKAPEDYLNHARDISDLHPVYLRNMLAAFRSAVQSKIIKDWEPLIILLELALRRTESAFPQEFVDLDAFDADRTWSPLRSTIALLLDDILRVDTVPSTFASNLWDMLVTLSEDPDPTTEDEARRASMEPAIAALNSVRGAALIAVVHYALWAYRRHKAGDLKQEKPWAPALSLLESHLDRTIDSSIAIRSIYGEYLPWLQNVDREWVAANAARIFPSAPDEAHYREAAWSTYLLYCPVYSGTYDLLKNIYAEEVNRLDQSVPTERDEIAASQHLGSHVWITYARGQADLLDPESLINVFLQKSSDELKRHIVDSIGRALHADTTITPEALERLRLLWNVILERKAAAPEAEQATVLRPFGWWFSSLRLGEEWSLQQLATVLQRTGGRIDPPFQVLPRLAELSTRYPLQCAELLYKMSNAVEPFQVMNIQEHGKPILENALGAGGQAEQMAIRINTLLSNQGIYTFRDLFRFR